ncbi:MAG: TSUP family transporter [Deltaproteobacteria bacterium]|nr:TSUP family transporter [Deltaproteobacteria bacterium]
MQKHIGQKMELYSILTIIFIFSIIQSVMGVGLLVFGTPTLLLCGLSFHETLGIVLPPSIIISLMQVCEAKVPSKDYFKSEFNKFCLPFVLVGMAIALTLAQSVDFKYFVGIMLIISGSIRLFKQFEAILIKVIKKNRKLYQVLMGLIHGLTNMGGGLLVLFSSSMHHNKLDIRSGVAYGYLFMGTLQYLTLLIYDISFLKFNILFYIITATLTYGVLGKRLFYRTHESIFQKMITSIIFLYGIILFVK